MATLLTPSICPWINLQTAPDGTIPENCIILTEGEAFDIYYKLKKWIVDSLSFNVQLSIHRSYSDGRYTGPFTYTFSTNSSKDNTQPPDAFTCDRSEGGRIDEKSLTCGLEMGEVNAPIRGFRYANTEDEASEGSGSVNIKLPHFAPWYQKSGFPFLYKKPETDPSEDNKYLFLPLFKVENGFGYGDDWVFAGCKVLFYTSLTAEETKIQYSNGFVPTDESELEIFFAVASQIKRVGTFEFMGKTLPIFCSFYFIEYIRSIPGPHSLSVVSFSCSANVKMSQVSQWEYLSV